MIPILVLARWVRREARAAQQALGHVEAVASESVRALELIQGFTWEGPARDMFGVALRRSRLAEGRYGAARAMLAGTTIAVVFAAVIALLWVAGYAALDGELAWGDLLAFVFFGGLIAGAAGGLAEIGGDVVRGVSALDRLQVVWSEGAPLPDRAVGTKPVPVAAAGGFGGSF